MEMTIDELIVFCENSERYHSTLCKRYDDASGYTRSRNEKIRTNDAKREEMDSKFYHELKKIVRKYQKIEEIYQKWNEVNDFSYNQAMSQIGEILKDGRDNIFLKEMPSVTPQEPKIKVLDRDEAMRKLGTVDVYQAKAWITLLKDLEYLGLKICEVEE